mmetsp:Transcript_27612/g.31915  ORF Transcript_27612/g.31915 Transcript_27612/m.31915 type:complete len:145 (+) Transcript_27612:50-484(+)
MNKEAANKNGYEETKDREESKTVDDRRDDRTSLLRHQDRTRLYCTTPPRSVASPELLHYFEIAFLVGRFLAIHAALLVHLRVKRAVPAQPQMIVVTAAHASVLESVPSAFVETGNGEGIVPECGAGVSFGFCEGLELDPANVYR